MQNVRKHAQPCTHVFPEDWVLRSAAIGLSSRAPSARFGASAGPVARGVCDVVNGLARPGWAQQEGDRSAAP
eukprot:11183518-Lingulodinium_polyedra.AAC.1